MRAPTSSAASRSRRTTTPASRAAGTWKRRTEGGTMGSLGSYLKRERELRQMSIAELAQITRIPARVLQHLENDAHSELPADVFVRGFLRSYAHAVGLDGESVLAR